MRHLPRTEFWPSLTLRADTRAFFLELAQMTPQSRSRPTALLVHPDRKRSTARRRSRQPLRLLSSRRVSRSTTLSCSKSSASRKRNWVRALGPPYAVSGLMPGEANECTEPISRPRRDVYQSIHPMGIHLPYKTLPENRFRPDQDPQGRTEDTHIIRGRRAVARSTGPRSCPAIVHVDAKKLLGKTYSYHCRAPVSAY
jgi:hypothetical protein